METETYTPEELAVVIESAARVIEGGWCRHEEYHGGRHCALGAVGRVTGSPMLVETTTANGHVVGSFHFNELANAAIRALRAEIRVTDPINYGHYGHVDVWNDYQRDKRKVVRLFNRCARKLRAGTLHY